MSALFGSTDVLRAPIALLLLASLFSAHADTGPDDAAYSPRGADTCLLCHRDELTLALFSGDHAVPSDPHGPFGPGQLQCEACHGPGGAHAGRVGPGEERPGLISFSADDTTLPDVQNGMCLDCHDADLGAGWHGGTHANETVRCADCHRSHTAEDAVMSTATQSEICWSCHVAQRADANKPYGHPLGAGKMACGDCHDAHDRINSEFALVEPTLNATCYQCHAELRGPFLWEHAPVFEDCSNCHEAHGSIHPGALSRRGPQLCQQCHSQSGHSSIALDADGLPGGMPSQFLLSQNCLNCHVQVHGSNHPSGSRLMR